MADHRALPADVRERLADGSWLSQKYQAEGLTSRDIGRLLGGVHESTVNRALARHGIPRRAPGKAAQVPAGRLADVQWLTQQVEQGRTRAEIAALEGVAEALVRKALALHGLQAQRGLPEGAAANRNPTLADEQWLRARYETDRLDIRDIAALAGASASTVLKALRRAGIPTRPRTERRAVYAQLHDQRWLREQHLLNGLNNRAIAQLLGCQPSSVSRALQDIAPQDREVSLVWRLHQEDPLTPPPDNQETEAPYDWRLLQADIERFATAYLREGTLSTAEANALAELTRQATMHLAELTEADRTRQATRLLLLAHMLARLARDRTSV